jgi:hypothetical protein
MTGCFQFREPATLQELFGLERLQYDGKFSVLRDCDITGSSKFRETATLQEVLSLQTGSSQFRDTLKHDWKTSVYNSKSCIFMT